MRSHATSSLTTYKLNSECYQLTWKQQQSLISTYNCWLHMSRMTAPRTTSQRASKRCDAHDVSSSQNEQVKRMCTGLWQEDLSNCIGVFYDVSAAFTFRWLDMKEYSNTAAWQSKQVHTQAGYTTRSSYHKIHPRRVSVCLRTRPDVDVTDIFPSNPSSIRCPSTMFVLNVAFRDGRWLTMTIMLLLIYQTY